MFMYAKGGSSMQLRGLGECEGAEGAEGNCIAKVHDGDGTMKLAAVSS